MIEPCIAGWSPAEIIAALGVALNALLLTFLVRRRVVKDRNDVDRWRESNLVSEEVASGRNGPRRTNGER